MSILPIILLAIAVIGFPLLNLYFRKRQKKKVLREIEGEFKGEIEGQRVEIGPLSQIEQVFSRDVTEEEKQRILAELRQLIASGEFEQAREISIPGGNARLGRPGRPNAF